MATPFLGEITLFAGNFAIRGWAFCSGQLLSIAQNTALFSLLGTTYGGNGINTFALPDLRSRVPVHPGNTDVIGSTGGEENVTLNDSTMPSHSHSLDGLNFTAASRVPTNNMLANPQRNIFGTSEASALAGGSIGVAGSSQSHSNIQPYLALSFIIALQGVFPSRS